MTSGTKRARPGRPEGRSDIRERILDEAELHFAEYGFSGTSLRQVAEKANVNSAMIAYYFSNKETLFREVFLRKGQLVADERMGNLRAMQARGDATVRDLVRGFLEPSIKLRETVQGAAFLRLHSRLHMEPEAISYELRRQVYDQSTRAYAEAFLELLPHRHKRQVYVQISLMIGAYLYTFSDTNRLDEMMDGSSEKLRSRVELEDIVEFVAAGMSPPA